MGRRTLGAPRPGRLIAGLEIESVDLEAQGIAHHDGKVVFVAGALAGERVDAQVLRERPSYIKAQAVAWHRHSPDRVTPQCPHYGVCGGCSIQHASPEAQMAYKQRVLEDTLWHIGRLRPEEVLPPLRGPSFGYRSRARLSVRWVDKKGGLLIGFRERASSYVAQMDTCPVLVPQASALLPALRDCLAQLSIAREIPQVELAAGEEQMVWVLRVMAEPSEEDLERLRAFASRHTVSLWLQAGGPQTAHRLAGASVSAPLTYRLGAANLTMPFSPVDFTQVNFPINRALVDRAVRLLDPQPGDRVADFFCGLGNFSLPLAQRAKTVCGVEGSAALVAQAQANAEALGFAEKVQFRQANLFEPMAAWLAQEGPFDRILIDPPREGAQALCEALAQQNAAAEADLEVLSEAGGQRVTRRLVMVSCNPATLARDAAILVHQGQWRLRQAGVVNMFPQTAHVESIAVFEPSGPRRF